MHQNHSDSLCTLHLNGFLASFFPTSTKSFLNECLLHLNGVYTFCISSHKHFQPSVKTFVVFNSCWRWSLYLRQVLIFKIIEASRGEARIFTEVHTIYQIPLTHLVTTTISCLINPVCCYLYPFFLFLFKYISPPVNRAFFSGKWLLGSEKKTFFVFQRNKHIEINDESIYLVLFKCIYLLFPDNSLFYFILLYIFLFSTFSGMHVHIMCTSGFTPGFLI